MISDKVSVLIMTLDFVGFLSSVSYFCAVTEIRQLVANSAQNSQPQETLIFTFTLKITNNINGIVSKMIIGLELKYMSR